MAKKGHYSKHPCCYVDDYNKIHLIIFRNFFKEYDLPKFKKVVCDDEKEMSNALHNVRTQSEIDSKDGPGSNYIVPSWNAVQSSSSDTSPYNYQHHLAESAKENCKKPTIWQKIKYFFKKKDLKPVDKAFDEIKESLKIPRSEDYDTIVKNLEKLYKFLKESGQYVQAEKIEKYGNILTYEIAASKAGITKYLTEKDIIDFMLKSDKGISITFLRYFSNILPMSVSLKKIETDKLKIFDNYVVLYYDPGVEVLKFHTEEEDRRLARDPILFGMIEGSNKLYYICDWIYNDDDLTMDKVENVLGRQSQLLIDAKKYEDEVFVDNMVKDLNEWVIGIGEARNGE